MFLVRDILASYNPNLMKTLAIKNTGTDRLAKAIFFSLSYGLFASFMSMLAKEVSAHTTDSMIVFFRFAISFSYILLVFGLKRLNGSHIRLATKHIGWHIFRAGSSFICLYLLYYSLHYLPLIDTNLLFLTNPLFIPILGALFLGSHTSKKNWLIILLGFLGVVLVIKPGTEMMHPASFLALLAGLFAAISLMSVHELGKTDSPHTIMFYYFSITFMISLVFAIITWKTPSWHVLTFLLLIGITSTLAQESAVRALVNAPAKIVSPLMYSAIVFSGILDWLVWNHIPTLLTFMGICVVCFSCLLMVLHIKKQKAECQT